MENKKINHVVLLSGGVDSALILANLFPLKYGDTVTTVHVTSKNLPNNDIQTDCCDKIVKYCQVKNATDIDQILIKYTITDNTSTYLSGKISPQELIWLSCISSCMKFKENEKYNIYIGYNNDDGDVTIFKEGLRDISNILSKILCADINIVTPLRDVKKSKVISDIISAYPGLIELCIMGDLGLEQTRKYSFDIILGLKQAMDTIDKSKTLDSQALEQRRLVSEVNKYINNYEMYVNTLKLLKDTINLISI